MGDLRSPRLMALKAGLFVVIGVVAASLILVEHPSWRVAALLALAIWAFARAYYFAFYVVEHYIDPSFKFAGLWSVVRHWMRTRKTGRRESAGDDPATPRS